MTAPRRRLLSFSLRTLFVVVTAIGFAFGGSVAYQLNWIRQRHAFLATAKKAETTDLATFVAIRSGDPGIGTLVVEAPIPPRVFGEGGVAGFAVVDNVGSERLADAKRLFPEANFTKLWADPGPNYLQLEMEEVLGPMSGWPVLPAALQERH